MVGSFDQWPFPTTSAPATQKLRCSTMPSSTALSTIRAGRRRGSIPAAGDQQVLLSVRGLVKVSNDRFKHSVSRLESQQSFKREHLGDLFLKWWYRCGDCREIRLLWNQGQPDNVSDGTVGTVDCGRCREHQHMERHGGVDTSVGCFYCRLFSRAIPHHRHLFPRLYFGIYVIFLGLLRKTKKLKFDRYIYIVRGIMIVDH